MSLTGLNLPVTHYFKGEESDEKHPFGGTIFYLWHLLPMWVHPPRASLQLTLMLPIQFWLSFVYTQWQIHSSLAGRLPLPRAEFPGEISR